MARVHLSEAAYAGLLYMSQLAGLFEDVKASIIDHTAQTSQSSSVARIGTDNP